MATAIKSLFPYLLSLLAGIAFGWWVTQNRYSADIARSDEKHAAEMKSVSDAAAKSASDNLAKVKEAQANLADLDKKSSEELQNAQDANSSLRNDVALGKRRVLIAQSKLTTCQRGNGGVSGTSSVGDAGSFELSGDTGSDILSLRSGIIADRAKITYLQNYISLMQSKGVISGSQSGGVSK